MYSIHVLRVASVTYSIDSFVDLASSYCSLIEHSDEYSTEDFMTRVREILPLLYHRGLGLPELEITDQDIDGAISHDEWSEMFTSLQRKLGINDHYWEVYDPLKTDHDDPVAACLSDDLADIWRDLKDGLSHWTDCSAKARQQIVWNWHFSFHCHWSDHLVDALRVINRQLEHYGTREGDNDT